MALPINKLDICNSALAYLGDLKIEDADLTASSITTPTEQRGRVCNQFYDWSLQALIEEFGFEVRAAKLQYAADFEEYNDTFETEPQQITAITQANPAVVTVAANGFPDKSHVYIYDINSMEELNQSKYFISVVDTDSFQLVGVNSLNFTTYSVGGGSYDGLVVRIQPHAATKYTYNLPADMLFPLYLDSKIDFSVFETNLISLDSEAVLFYAGKTETVGVISFSSFGASFLEALKIKLAINMSGRLMGVKDGLKLRTTMYQELQLALDKAKQFISNHSQTTIDYSGDFSDTTGSVYPSYFSYSPHSRI